MEKEQEIPKDDTTVVPDDSSISIQMAADVERHKVRVKFTMQERSLELDLAPEQAVELGKMLFDHAILVVWYWDAGSLIIPKKTPTNTTIINDIDLMNKPPHYTLPKGVEVIDVLEHIFDWEEQRGLMIGQAIQYLLRSGRKGGEEDIRKAKWWIDRYLNNLDGKTDDNVEPKTHP